MRKWALSKTWINRDQKGFCDIFISVAFFCNVFRAEITEDKAMGLNDAIHCHGAGIYVMLHLAANEWVFICDVLSDYHKNSE